MSAKHLQSDIEFAGEDHKVRKECGRHQKTSEAIKNGCRQDRDRCPYNEIGAWPQWTSAGWTRVRHYRIYKSFST